MPRANETMVTESGPAPAPALQVAPPPPPAPAAPDPRIDEQEHRLQELQKQLEATSKAYQSERLQLNGEIERLEERIHYVPGSQDGVSKGVVDQLRKQYEQRLQETIQQKTQLAEQLQSTSSLLEAERARSSAREATHSGLDEKDIAAEVSRVESLIKEIVALIDNPETEMSTIIRKNVQKAELDAYLKGILFVLNRGKEA